MSTAPPSPPPAGWYADPLVPGHERWWSGIGWTEHRQADGSAAPHDEPTAVPIASVEAIEPVEVPLSPEATIQPAETAAMVVQAAVPIARAVAPTVPRNADVRGRWGAGSIISIVLAVIVFIVLAVWLSPWWLLLPLVVFGVLWLVNDRGRVLRSVHAAPADAVRHARVLEHVRSAASAMSVAMPEVYVSPQPVRNAFALTDRKGGIVCVFQGTLDALADDELGAVLAHEVGHLKNRDSLYMAFFESVRISLTVVFIAIALLFALAIALLTRGRGGAIAGIFGAGVVLVGAAASFLLITAGQRSREYGADRLSAETQPDPLALGRALERLQQTNDRFEIGEIPITVAARCIVPPFASSFASDIVASHPSTARRIARIERLMGAERAAELRQRASADRWRIEADARARSLELARSAQPTPLSGSQPFLALPDEKLWVEVAAKVATPKSVDGQQGFQIGESGRLFVTTERALFVGATGRVEWRWTKLHEINWIGEFDRGELVVISVEDRRRNSGVWVDKDGARRLHPMLDLAIAERRGDRAALVARLETAVSDHARVAPTP